MHPPPHLIRVLHTITFVFLLGLANPLTSRADEAQDLYNRALTQVQQQHYQEAAASLQKALEIFPRFAAAQHLLGVVDSEILSGILRLIV